MKMGKFAAAAGVVAVLSVGVAAVSVLGGAAPVAPAVASGAFEIDAVHTSVVFKIQRVNGAPFYGRFDKISGSFDLSGDKPVLDVTIPVDSINSNNAGRDRHLKSPDFFAAGEHPNLTFKATGAKKAGEGEWDITGDLTARGVTKPVTIKAKQTGTGSARGGGTMIGYDMTFTIKRADFGITYGPQALGEDVTLMVGLEGVKK